MTIQNKKVLIDSNIWIYSSNTLSPKYQVAKDFRTLAQNKDFDPYIAYQNVNEILRVLTHKNYNSTFTMEIALKQVSSFMNIAQVISPQKTTLNLSLELISKYNVKSNQIYDNYLVATAITHGIDIIATDNEKDFKKYKEIKVYNPFKN